MYILNTLNISLIHWDTLATRNEDIQMFDSYLSVMVKNTMGMSRVREEEALAPLSALVFRLWHLF
jgi:hypothetical protein